MQIIAISAVILIALFNSAVIISIILKKSSAGFSATLELIIFAPLLATVPAAAVSGNEYAVFLTLTALAFSSAALIFIIFFKPDAEIYSIGGLMSAERSNLKVDESSKASLSEETRTRAGMVLSFEPPHKKEPPASLEALLERGDEGFDMGLAAFVMARENRPSLDVKSESRRMDELAARLEKYLESRVDGEEKLVRAVIRFFFDELGFESVEEEPRKSGLDALLLPDVLNRRRGHCLSLSLAFLSITRRVGLKFYGVSVPRHFFVRYDSGSYRRNIETTRRGEELQDRYYADKYNITRESIERGLYLRNLSDREVIVEALNNRAVYYYRTGEIEKSMLDLHRAISAGISFAAGYGGLGVLHLGRGEFEKAIQNAAEAVRLDPAFMLGHLALGEAYLRQGMYEEAAGSFRSVLECDPNLAQARTDLGRVFQKQGKIAEAKACHFRALALNPRMASAYNNLGIIYSEEGKIDEAISAFKRALKLERGFIIARENLAKSMLSAGLSRKASKEIRRVIRDYELRIRRNPESRFLKASLERFLSEIGHSPAQKR
jgi:tetratricopeptide (TPR) repeat protein